MNTLMPILNIYFILWIGEQSLNAASGDSVQVDLVGIFMRFGIRF